MNTATNDKGRNVSAKDNNVPVSVPYVVYRDAVSDNQWVVKRLVIAVIVAVCLMFASNIAWLIVWNSYDFETTETVVESNDTGVANYTGGNGDINYGTSDSPQDDQNEAQGNPGETSP